MSGLKEFHATFTVFALKAFQCNQAKLTGHSEKYISKRYGHGNQSDFNK